ncbi:MAG: glucosaminidase domain-containing protein [Treponema sp.]|nr:glucosaminidase domain-containing protein [Treponema sp.]
MNKNCFLKNPPFSFFVLISFLSVIFFSCVTPPQKEECSRELLGNGIKNTGQLVKFFMSHKEDGDKEKAGRLAEYYVEEAAIEGINSDVAFVQMCLETGFLGFGNLVLPEMNNFCGLGAMDAEHPGEYFESERIGVRAHIQHLHAYATTPEVELKQECVDPRYSWPHKVKFARTVQELAGHWATDPEYGIKLNNLLDELSAF